MPKLEAVIFDADGTLFDTFELIVSAYQHVAETYGLRIPTSSEVRAQMGKSIPDILRHFYPGVDINMLLETSNEYFATNIMKSEAFKGAENLLAHLQAQGLRLAILTNGNTKVHNTLRHHKLDRYFSSVVHLERIQKPKPDPEGFLLACSECGVKPHEAIMVGDVVTDIETGKNASALATIAVTHGFGSSEELKRSQANYVVDGIAGIKTVLSQLMVPGSAHAAPEAAVAVAETMPEPQSMLTAPA